MDIIWAAKQMRKGNRTAFPYSYVQTELANASFLIKYAERRCPANERAFQHLDDCLAKDWELKKDD